MGGLRKERAYEKYALVFLFALGVWILIPSLIIMVTGGPEYPPGGFYFLGVAVLAIAISSTGYRRGKRWAWYVSLSFPVLGLAEAILYEVDPPALVLFVLSVPGLLLPYRKFFPKKQPVVP